MACSEDKMRLWVYVGQLVFLTLPMLSLYTTLYVIVAKDLVKIGQGNVTTISNSNGLSMMRTLNSNVIDTTPSSHLSDDTQIHQETSAGGHTTDFKDVNGLTTIATHTPSTLRETASDVDTTISTGMNTGVNPGTSSGDHTTDPGVIHLTKITTQNHSPSRDHEEHVSPIMDTASSTYKIEEGKMNPFDSTVFSIVNGILLLASLGYIIFKYVYNGKELMSLEIFLWIIELSLSISFVLEIPSLALYESKLFAFHSVTAYFLVTVSFPALRVLVIPIWYIEKYLEAQCRKKLLRLLQVTINVFVFIVSISYFAMLYLCTLRGELRFTPYETHYNHSNFDEYTKAYNDVLDKCSMCDMNWLNLFSLLIYVIFNVAFACFEYLLGDKPDGNAMYLYIPLVLIFLESSTLCFYVGRMPAISMIEWHLKRNITATMVFVSCILIFLVRLVFYPLHHLIYRIKISAIRQSIYLFTVYGFLILLWWLFSMMYLCTIPGSLTYRGADDSMQFSFHNESVSCQLFDIGIDFYFPLVLYLILTLLIFIADIIAKEKTFLIYDILFLIIEIILSIIYISVMPTISNHVFEIERKRYAFTLFLFLALVYSIRIIFLRVRHLPKKVFTAVVSFTNRHYAVVYVLTCICHICINIIPLWVFFCLIYTCTIRGTLHIDYEPNMSDYEPDNCARYDIKGVYILPLLFNIALNIPIFGYFVRNLLKNKFDTMFLVFLFFIELCLSIVYVAEMPRISAYSSDIERARSANIMVVFLLFIYLCRNLVFPLYLLCRDKYGQRISLKMQLYVWLVIHYVWHLIPLWILYINIYVCSFSGNLHFQFGSNNSYYAGCEGFNLGALYTLFVFWYAISNLLFILRFKGVEWSKIDKGLIPCMVLEMVISIVYVAEMEDISSYSDTTKRKALSSVFFVCLFIVFIPRYGCYPFKICSLIKNLPVTAIRAPVTIRSAAADRISVEDISKLKNNPFVVDRTNSLPLCMAVNQLVQKTWCYSDQLGRDAIGLSHGNIRVLDIFEINNVHNNQLYSNWKCGCKYSSSLTNGSLSILTKGVCFPENAETIRLVNLDEKEVLLFHGTPVHNVEQIIDNGFLLSKCVSDAFGRGIYLTDSIQKADQYTDTGKRRQRGLTIIVVKACLGKVKEYINSTSRQNADTIVVSHLRFQEFVIKNPAQILPLFVIVYDRI